MTNYLPIQNAETTSVINNLLHALHSQVISSGGDGDAVWYSRFFYVNDIKRLVYEYNQKLAYPWEIKIRDDKTFDWGNDQEWITITNDEEMFMKLPEWIELKLRY